MDCSQIIKTLFLSFLFIFFLSTSAFGAPSIESVSPESGTSNGGTEVTIYGSNFVSWSEAYVSIGGNRVSYYGLEYANDGSWLRFDTPAHSAGVVDVTVTNPDGQQDNLVDAYTYLSDIPQKCLPGVFMLLLDNDES